jgi:hypothetical protein
MRFFCPPRLRLDPLEGFAERRVGTGAGTCWVAVPHGHAPFEAEETRGRLPDCGDPFARLAARIPGDRFKDVAPEPERDRWPDIE